MIKTKFIGLGLAVLLCCGLAKGAVGDGFLDAVPNGATWLIQGKPLQLAAMPVLQRAFAGSRGGGALAPLLALAALGSVNVTSDIARVTAIGLDATGLVVVVEGRWNSGKLKPLAERQPGFRKLNKGGVDLLCVDGPRPGDRAFVSFFGPQKILIGSTAAAVVAVHEALVRPGVEIGAFRNFSKATQSPDAVLSLFAKDGESLMQLIPDAAMLLQTTAIALHVRPLPRNQLGVNLSALAVDAPTALNVAQMLTGLQAMLAFRSASDPTWGTLAQSMNIKTAETRVLIDFSLDSEMTASLLTTALREMRRKGRL
jgi:hypothetical protein